MTMYFPPTPSDGDPYENNGITYIYDAATNTWNAVTSVPGESYTKAEADAKFVEVAGDAMTGTLSMGNNPIQNLATATSDYEAANLFNVKTEADKKVDKQGDVMTGDLEMSGQKVMVLGDPTLEDDAVNKRYSDAEDKKLEDAKVDRDGDIMSGNLALQDATGDPLPITSRSHATTKEYVDEAIANNVANPLTYHGKIDATQTGPTSIPVEAGDFYIHDTDGNYSPGEIDVLWGFPPGTEIEDLDRLLYDGTAWAILHTAGDYVSKIGGDTMEGPLRVTNQDGDSSQANSTIYTYGITSPGSSNLEIRNNNATKMYIGNSSVSVNVPFQTNEIRAQGPSTTTKYTGDINDPQSIATKGYIDSQFAGRIAEVRFRYDTSTFNPGDFQAGTTPGNYAGSPIAAEDIGGILISKTDLNGNQIDPTSLYGYISLTKQGGQAYYLIVSSNTGLNDYELNVAHQFGAGFNFVQDDIFVIEPANELLMTTLFVNKFTPEMFGNVTINDASLTLDRSSNTNKEVIGIEVKPNNDDSVTGGQEVHHKFGNPGNNGSHRFEFGGYGVNKKVRIQGRSGGAEDLLVFDTSGQRLTNYINTIDIGGKKLVNVNDTNPGDDEVVSLGYITEQLQEKFEDLINQSTQGTYSHSTVALPASGQFAGFDGIGRHITNTFYDISAIEKVAFHDIDRDGHPVDFSVLSVGDYILLVIDNEIARFRVEAAPVDLAGSPVTEVEVGYLSGGVNGPNTDYFNLVSVQFQKISGSVDLDDYVKVDGDNEMTGALTITRANANDNLFIGKQGTTTNITILASGKITTEDSVDVGANVNFLNGANGIKLVGDDRILFKTSTTNPSVQITYPASTRTGRQGFRIDGKNASGTTYSSGLLNVYHNTGTTADEINYRGRQTEDINLATMGKVNEKLSIDGSDSMTGQLTVAYDDAQILIDARNAALTGKEAKLTFFGNRTGNSNPIGTMLFENASSSQTGKFSFSSDNNSNATTAANNAFFNFSHDIRFRGGKCTALVDFDGTHGENVARFKGHVMFKKAGNNIDQSNIFEVTGDDVQYLGPMTSDNEVVTVKKVKTDYPYKIVKSGDAYFIDPV